MLFARKKVDKEMFWKVLSEYYTERKLIPLAIFTIKFIAQIYCDKKIERESLAVERGQRGRMEGIRASVA